MTKTYHQKPLQRRESNRNLIYVLKTDHKYSFMYTPLKELFSTLYVYNNNIMTTKTLKTGFNQSRLGAGTVSPGPHGRGRKLEENP